MSADYDLVSNLNGLLGLILASRTATAQTAGADTQKWKSLMFGWYVGIGGITFDASNRIDVVIEESDDDSTYAAVASEDDVILPYGLTFAAGGIVKSYIAAKAAADTAYNLVGYRGKKRYARLKFLFTGTHGSGTPTAAYVIQGHPMHKPAWQSSIEA
jgi:hypothetical protein